MSFLLRLEPSLFSGGMLLTVTYHENKRNFFKTSTSSSHHPSPHPQPPATTNSSTGTTIGLTTSVDTNDKLEEEEGNFSDYSSFKYLRLAFALQHRGRLVGVGEGLTSCTSHCL